MTKAKGSLMETETYVMLAIRPKYVSQEDATDVLVLIVAVSKMLFALRSRHCPTSAKAVPYSR